jgi:hypothetical protein
LPWSVAEDPAFPSVLAKNTKVDSVIQSESARA